eukprot:31499-Pelagococcus_subviridis.AAC.28
MVGVEGIVGACSGRPAFASSRSCRRRSARGGFKRRKRRAWRERPRRDLGAARGDAPASASPRTRASSGRTHRVSAWTTGTDLRFEARFLRHGRGAEEEERAVSQFKRANGGDVRGDDEARWRLVPDDRSMRAWYTHPMSP